MQAAAKLYLTLLYYRNFLFSGAKEKEIQVQQQNSLNYRIIESYLEKLQAKIEERKIQEALRDEIEVHKDHLESFIEVFGLTEKADGKLVKNKSFCVVLTDHQNQAKAELTRRFHNEIVLGKSRYDVDDTCQILNPIDENPEHPQGWHMKSLIPSRQNGSEESVDKKKEPSFIQSPAVADLDSPESLGEDM